MMANPEGNRASQAFVAKARLGMETARCLTAFSVVLAGGCPCAVNDGRHYADELGNVYLTVDVTETLCVKHRAANRRVERAIFRLAIVDHEEDPAVLPVSADHAAEIMPRLREIDMGRKAASASDVCMM